MTISRNTAELKGCWKRFMRSILRLIFIQHIFSGVFRTPQRKVCQLEDKSFFPAKIPFSYKLISPFRLLSPWIFESFDLSKYDLIITSATGAYLSNLILKRPETFHICYCHTPPRYLYGYPTARNWKKHTLGRIVGEYFNHHLRYQDFISAQRPDYFIANSHEVRRRIWKFYRREAVVIYPPVNTESRIKNQESR